MKKILLSILTIASLGASAQNHVLNFDGTNDYVNLNNISSVSIDNARTIELWFKLNETINSSNTNPQALIYRDNNINSNNSGLYFSGFTGDNGHLVFQRNNGTSVQKVISDDNTWIAGVWHHVAAVIDPVVGMMMYVDGVLQQNTNIITTGSINASSDIFMLGRWGSSSIRYFNGSMDEVRIWDYAVSSSDINTKKCDTLTVANETGLISYWKMNGSIGIANNITDASGNGHTGVVGPTGATRVNDITCTDENDILNFDGESDYCNLGNQVLNGVRSIELWFRPAIDITNSLSSSQALVYRNHPTNASNSGLYISGFSGSQGKISFQRNTSSTATQIYSNNDNWSAGVWYHVVGVIHPINGLELYIDGVKQTDVHNSTSAISSSSNTSVIGKWGSTNIRYFNGDIDEVRFWNRAISLSEINLKKCDTLIVGNELDLNAYWKMDDGSGTTLTEHVNGINSTISGAVWARDSINCQISTSGLETIDASQNVTLTTYPNPTTGVVNFSTTEQINNIAIYNLTGQQVAMFSNTNTIDISNLPSGIYTAKISIDGKLAVKKIIKE